MGPSRSSRAARPTAALVILEHGPKSAESAVAANIGQLRPSKEMVAAARQAFEDLGFSTTDVVGNSFSIEAPLDRFENVFKVKLQVGTNGGLTVRKARGAPSLELPRERLPQNVRALVRTITFSEPPSFGPSGSGP